MGWSIWQDGVTWDEAQAYMASALPGPGTAAAAAIEGIRWGVDPTHRERRGQQIYDTTGYDPMDVNEYDYFGKDVNRNIAGELGDPRQKQYDAMAEQIAQNFAGKRTRSTQSAQARGLQSSGYAQQQSDDLYEAQAMQENQMYAQLLNEEQAFLDQLYQGRLDQQFQLELQRRQEALARQKMTMDLITEFIPFVGSVGGSTSDPLPQEA